MNIKNIKHGATVGDKAIPEYNSWRGCKQRCFNPNHHRYNSYGKVGITVCERWLGKEGFKNFLEDMGPRPEPKFKYSIERIDPRGDYTPTNCVWSDAKRQARNVKFRKKVCIVCNSSTAGFAHRKYCSSRCSYLYRRYQDKALNYLKEYKAPLVKRTEKKCPICFIFFKGTSLQKYCEKECRQRSEFLTRRNKNFLIKNKKTFKSKCAICEIEFIGYRPSTKTCSLICRKIHKYQRDKLHKIKSSPGTTS